MIEPDEQMCPLCLDWGPPTETGFCLTCRPTSIRKVPSRKLRLKHCAECGRPERTHKTGGGMFRCPRCRNRCKVCGEPCQRPASKKWGRNITCPRCISRQRSDAARIGNDRRRPPERTCQIEGCEVVIERWQRHRRYCEEHEVESYRLRTATMPRTAGGRFLPRASERVL